MSDKNLPQSLWKFYFKYAFKEYRWLILLWMLLACGLTADRVIFPLTQKWIVQIFEQPVIAGQNFILHALPVVLLIAGLNMFVSVSAILRDWTFTHWAPQLTRRLSTVLTEYAHNQSMSFWTGRMPGQVNTQINQITDGAFAIRPIWVSVLRIGTIFINGALLFMANKYVAYMFIGILAFRIIFAWKMGRPLKKSNEEHATATSRLSGKLVDSLSNYAVVKYFARARGEETYLAPARQKRVDTAIWRGFMERVFYWVPGLLWDVFLGVTILLCVYLYSLGGITIANAVYSVTIYMGVMMTISQLINDIPDVLDKIGAASRAYKELVMPIAIMDAENAEPLVVSRGKIEFRNVSFKYKRKWVLRNLNLTINPGQRVGLVGASGAGKSTLVNLLMRFYEPNQGQILIDGQDIRDVTQDSLRESIAFIPQDPMMFNRTLRENIGYGRADATMADIRKAARRAAADEFITATDKKYDSMVGDRGIKLSGGQRQRVAIARAFLKDAPILVLDEATSALDSQTEVAIQHSFDELAAGRTTLAIAHRLSTLRNMDKIVVMRNGRIIEQGTHTALLRRRGEYARLWKMQSGGFIQE